MTQKNYSADSPVESEKQDNFSRWHFANNIAQLITKRDDPDCIVLGLYGTWGSGKTSTLNFIETSLKNDDKVICIWFNPWRFGTEDELLVSLFHKIAKSLDKNLTIEEEVIKNFMKYAKPIGSLVRPIINAHTGGALNQIIPLLSSVFSENGAPTIDELKEKLEKLLEENDKRILIFVDDIDRLEKSEIQALFKIIKLTANLKNTAYILAFDKDIVSASLQEKYPNSVNNHINAGSDFIEKIVQIPLNLPPIQHRDIFNFCYAGIKEVLQDEKIKFSQKRWRAFAGDFSDAFDDCLTTPRKVILYINALKFALPILKDEVNLVDLMFLEAIRIFTPSLYDFIQKNKNLFLGNIVRGDTEDISIQERIDTALNNENLISKEKLLKLLQQMFPELKEIYGIEFGTEMYKEWAEEKRICSERYFSRFFLYTVS